MFSLPCPAPALLLALVVGQQVVGQQVVGQQVVGQQVVGQQHFGQLYTDVYLATIAVAITIVLVLACSTYCIVLYHRSSTSAVCYCCYRSYSNAKATYSRALPLDCNRVAASLRVPLLSQRAYFNRL